MNTSSVKGYVLVVFSGLAILAAVLLLVLQWGNRSAFSLYGKNYGQNPPDGGVNTALLMLLSAAGGLVMAGLIWILFRGARAIRKGRRAEAQEQIRRRLKDLEKSPPVQRAE